MMIKKTNKTFCELQPVCSSLFDNLIFQITIAGYRYYKSVMFYPISKIWSSATCYPMLCLKIAV